MTMKVMTMTNEIHDDGCRCTTCCRDRFDKVDKSLRSGELVLPRRSTVWDAEPDPVADILHAVKILKQTFSPNLGQSESRTDVQRALAGVETPW